MRRLVPIILGVSFWILFSSHSSHKFYVSMYQLNFVPEKQMLQITSRIFLDDLNNAVEKKSGEKVYLGESLEKPRHEQLMRDYLLANMSLRINQKPVSIEFRTKEVQEDVMVCYFRVTGVADIKSLWMRNKNLFDLEPDQQNIIQTQVRGQKKAMLLTADSPEDQINY